MQKLISVLVISAFVTGCATRGANYQPMVDTKNKSAAAIAQDTMECQQFAKKTMDAASGAVAGAIAGAVLMALIMPHGYRNYAAGQGAAAGAVAGAASATDTQETIIKRCLAGRGYSVLN